MLLLSALFNLTTTTIFVCHKFQLAVSALLHHSFSPRAAAETRIGIHTWYYCRIHCLSRCLSCCNNIANKTPDPHPPPTTLCAPAENKYKNTNHCLNPHNFLHPHIPHLPHINKMAATTVACTGVVAKASIVAVNKPRNVLKAAPCPKREWAQKTVSNGIKTRQMLVWQPFNNKYADMPLDLTPRCGCDWVFAHANDCVCCILYAGAVCCDVGGAALERPCVACQYASRIVQSGLCFPCICPSTT